MIRTIKVESGIIQFLQFPKGTGPKPLMNTEVVICMLYNCLEWYK